MQIPYGVNVSENCRDLILRLLRRDPDERITFDEFFNHPFVDLEHCASNESLSKAVSILNILNTSHRQYPQSEDIVSLRCLECKVFVFFKTERLKYDNTYIVDM